MKTIVIESRSPLSWYFLPDSALINTGKPFFVPEFADEFEAFVAPVVRLNRIGKSISARFAERYYTEIAPAIHIRASRLRRTLLEAGLPTDPSHSFDRSMTVGNFIPVGSLSDDASLVMTLDHARPQSGHASATPAPAEVVCSSVQLKSLVGPLLEAVSRTNTIKMGDYLVPMLSSPLPIEIGDTLTVKYLTAPAARDSETLITLHIK